MTQIPIYGGICEWNVDEPHPEGDDICWISPFLYYYVESPPFVDRYVDVDRILDAIKYEEARHCTCDPMINVHCDVHYIMNDIKRVIREELE